MIVECPHCGRRPSEEFTCLGDATPRRPQSDPPAPIEQWFDYVYLRDNPKGRFAEYWHHSGGCRAWLVVERDTESHEIFSVVTARDWAKRPFPLPLVGRGQGWGSDGEIPATPTLDPSPQGGGKGARRRGRR
jgi:heterotetrameric sarcosine oxidase delta subunit